MEWGTIMAWKHHYIEWGTIMAWNGALLQHGKTITWNGVLLRHGKTITYCHQERNRKPIGLVAHTQSGVLFHTVNENIM